MKDFLFRFKNKYVLTITIFVVYILFLDDLDIFNAFRQSNKLTLLERQKETMSKQLEDTRSQLNKLRYSGEVERYAREKKLFKRDDEDVFVISNE